MISLNQCLGCVDDVGLLLFGFQSTSDLLFVIRYERPTLFVDNTDFVQMAAVAQGIPFGLSMDLLTNATICGQGSY